MATVQLGPNDTLEVPDDWDAQQVTDHLREVRPGLFVQSGLSYNPPPPPPQPSVGALKFASERQAALDEQKQIDSILERLSNTSDAGVWERAGELLSRGGAQIASSFGSLARAPLEVAAENLPTGVSRALAALWQASDLARVSNIGRAGDDLLDLIPSRAPTFGQARTLAANSSGLETIEPFLQMMAQAAGENAPQLAASAGLAGLPMLPGLSHTARAALASFITALPQESGGIYQGMRDKGISATKAAAITSLAGPLSAAFETVGEVPLVGRMLGEGSRSLRKLPGRLVGQGALEAATETLQEGVGIGAETVGGKPPSKDEIIERLGSSAISGFGAGAGSSAVVDVGNRIIHGPDKITTPQPPKPEEVEPHRFVKIAEKYGVDPSQIEVVPQKIGADELKAIGHTSPDLQAYVTPEGKVRVFEPSVTSDKEFDQIIREEVAHKRLMTPEGRAAVAAFTESNPLTEQEREKLAQYTIAPGETELQHRQRLTDEFLAKLDRDSWWTKLVDKFSATVKNTFGITLNNREAGRALLRSIPGRQAAVVQEVQSAPVAVPAPAPASIQKDPSKDPYDIKIRNYTEPLDLLQYKKFSEIPETAFSGPDLELFKALRSTGIDPAIDLGSTRGIRMWSYPAKFDPSSNAMLLNDDRSLFGSANFSREVVLHEAVHSATFKAIRDPSKSHLVDRLQNLRVAAKSNWKFAKKSDMPESLRDIFDHAFSNVDEFCSAALTNYKFQRFLDSIKTTQRHKIGETKRFGGTMLRRFFDALSVLLGVRDGTILSEALTLTEELFPQKPRVQTYESMLEQSVFGSMSRPASIPQEPKLDPRKSRDSIRITEDVAREFPGLKIQYNSPIAEDDGKAVQVGPDGSIRVMANRANPKTIRREVIESAVKSGTMMLREGDREHLLGILEATRPADVKREAKMLGADMNTGEGRTRVLASMLSGLSPKSPLLRRLGARMKLSGEDAKTVSRAINVALDRFRSAEPQRFQAQSQEQIFADDRAVFYSFRPLVQALKDTASEIETRSLARKQFGVIQEHVDNIKKQAESRILDDPRLGPKNEDGKPIPLNPKSEHFLNQVEHAGREVTEQDKDVHHIFRTENYSRALIRLDEKLGKLQQLKKALEEKVEFFGLKTYSPEQVDSDIKAAEQEIEKLKAAAEKSGLDVGEIEARATELRESDDQVRPARAAQRVLANPVVAAMVEAIDQIDDSGVKPRPLSDLSAHHASQAQVAHSMQRAAYRHLADTVKEAQAKWLHGEYAKQLTSLRRQLTDTNSRSGSIEVQIHDLIQTLARSLGLSGSLQSREAATLLRDQNSAIARMALALADADPDTTAGQLRESIIALPSGSLIPSTRIRELAARAGVSEEVLTKVLRYTRELPEFHNAVVTLFERATSAAQNATVTAIEQIENALEEETEAGDQRAQEVANRALSRLRSRNRELTGSSHSIESQLAELEDERLYWEKFREFTSREVPDPDGTRRMLHPIENGWILNAFKHPEGEQPEIIIRAGDEFTQNTLQRLVAWQQNAAAATANHTVDQQTQLGLIVAQQAVSEFISANFTQDQIFKALAPGKFMGVLEKLFTRTAENLAMYVPGFFGDRIRKAASIYDNTGGKIERLKTKHVAPFNRMFKRAAESLGLNLRVPGEAARLGAAYNEVSHRLAQHGSGVAEGDVLLYDTVRGKTITPELLNLIRYTRTLGREGQEILAKHLYGGVRVDLPGRQVVRPPAERGDLGLGRLPNQAKTFRLAGAYTAGVDAQGNAVATKPDSPQVIQFWNSDPDAILSAVDDMNRQDFGLATDKILKRLAREAMNGIRMRGDTVPYSIDEWVDRLTAFAPEGIGGKDGVRKLFLEHLSQYGRVAIAKHPPNSKAPLHSTGVIATEDDRNEFSSPAAKTVFPGSYYEYGSSNGLSSFIGRVASLSYIEYRAALKAAASHLSARRFAISQAVNGDLTPFHDEIKYYTNDIWSGQEVTKARAEAAMGRMDQYAKRIAKEAEATERGFPSIKPLSKAISSIASWKLAMPMTAMVNVLSGPIAAHQFNKQVFGLPRATLQSLWHFALASPHFAYDMISSAANMLPDGYVPQFLNQREMRDYLESDGIGGSYSREELAEADKFADGHSQSTLDRLLQANQSAAKAVQNAQGVGLGDSVLNRFGVRQVIPPAIRKLNQIAAMYAGRLAAMGLERADPNRKETLLNEEDTGTFRGVREMLSEFGNPEDILIRLANGEVDAKYFWRSELGRRIGTALLYKFNPASRTNRPLSSDMTLFLGWTSHQLHMMAAAYRTPADSTRSQKIMHLMTNAASDALVGITAFYLSAAAGGFFVGFEAQVLRAIGKLLAGDPPPEEEGKLFSWIEHKLSFIIGALKKIPGLGLALNATGKVFDAAGKAVTPTAKLHPGKTGFWDRPISEIAIDIAKAGPASFGLSLDSARIPFISMLQQGVGGVGQTARGVTQYVAGWGDPGAEAGAKADIRAGIRTSMGMYGFAGQTLSDLLLPGGQEDRIAGNLIRDAAFKEGIRIEPMTFTQDPLSLPTPIRKTLMEYGRRLADGDQSAAGEIDGMAKYVYDRAYNRTINNGGTEEEAGKAGETAVKGMLRTLNPVEHAIGHTLSQEQYDALKKRLGTSIDRDEKAANAVIDQVSANPPAGNPFNPSESMRSAIKAQPQPKRSGRRRTLRGASTRRSLRSRSRIRFARSLV